MSIRPLAPETAQGLVSDAMSSIAGDAAEEAATRRREALRREARARRLKLTAAILLPLCGALTIGNLAGFDWLGRAGEPGLSPTQARAAAMLLLSDAVDELEFFMQQHRRYPEEPAFLGPDGAAGDDEPFVYELVGKQGYVLSVTVADETVSFDSSQDPETVFREVRNAR